MASFFAEKENKKKLTEFLGGVAPEELPTPIHVNNDHGIEIIKCRNCKAVKRDRDVIEISRKYSVYQCPECKAFFKNP